MRALSSADCLDVWERGLRLHPLDRGLLALGAALPQTSYDVLADWPLGRRNRALAELQCACFGRNLQGQVSCAGCGEDLEFQMDAQDLLKNDAELHASVFVGGNAFRLPTTRDLAQAAREPDPRLGVRKLVEFCRIDASVASDWREEDLEEIGEKMSAADPLAEIRLTFHCIKCGHEWQENWDITAFLWMEIEARSKRLLVEVHTLAAAYGWTEQETLSLSEARRTIYLEMARA
jgi:hypothetical protein